MSLKMFFFLFLLVPGLAYSQSVKVKKETSRIKAENAEGYEVTLEASEEQVKSFLSKFLKNVGKLKTSDEVITINEPLVEGRKYSHPLYSTVRSNGNTTAAWMGILLNEWGSEAATVEKDLERLAHDFGVYGYREKIQLQIDESLKALQIVEKQQLRLSNQNKDLVNKIENNKKQKIQLEKSLVTNQTDLEILSKKLEENKRGQDSVAIATDQIKKVVEMHKETQRKVH